MQLDQNMKMILLGSALLLIVVAALMLRKKKDPSDNNSPVVPPPAVVPPSPTIPVIIPPPNGKVPADSKPVHAGEDKLNVSSHLVSDYSEHELFNDAFRSNQMNTQLSTYVHKHLQPL